MSYIQKQIQETEKRLSELREKEALQIQNVYKEIDAILSEWEKKLDQIKDIKDGTWRLNLHHGVDALSDYCSQGPETGKLLEISTPWTFQKYILNFTNAKSLTFFAPKKEDLLPPKNSEAVLAFFGVQYRIERNEWELSTEAEQLASLLQDIEAGQDETTLQHHNDECEEVHIYYRMIHLEATFENEQAKQTMLKDSDQEKEKFLENLHKKRKRTYDEDKEKCRMILRKLSVALN